MALTSQAHQENVVSLAEVRAERRAARLISLEMDWTRDHAEQEEPWAMGKTIWFAVVVSSALWAVIAGALWLV